MSETAKTQSPYRIYVVTWAILLVITVAMLMAESFNMPRWFLVLFLLAFMMVKAVMIAGNFMHLKFESHALWYIVGGGLLVTSLILFVFLVPETVNVLQRSGP